MERLSLVVVFILVGACAAHGFRTHAISHEPVDGRCPDRLVLCPCGAGKVEVAVRRCLRFDHWGNKYCEKCQTSLNSKRLCRLFRNCAMCDGKSRRCTKCPFDKYGKLCKKDCKCENGATCNQNGSCVCTKEYTGVYCEHKIGGTCQFPEPREHMSLMTYNLSTKVSVILQVESTCEFGYELIGPTNIYCENGEWDSNLPNCRELARCPVLKVKHGITETGNNVKDDKVLEGAEITIECFENYVLIGPSRLVCNPKGQWEGGTVSCVKKTDLQPSVFCPELPSLEHGVVVPEAQGTSVPGVRVEYQCDENYILVGNRTNHCCKNGQWSSKTPKCLHVITCDEPGVSNNMIHCFGEGCRNMMFNSFVYNSGNCLSFVKVGGVRVDLPLGRYPEGTVVEYRCNLFYRLRGKYRRICDDNGKWTGQVPYCEAECGRRSTSGHALIVNGTKTTIEQWPWHVGLSVRTLRGQWGITCGGSLFSDDWIVTAAHCLNVSRSRPFTAVKVWLGKLYHDTSVKSAGVQQRSVDQVFVHPNFSLSSLDSDIALLHLKKPATLNNKVTPICLPPNNDITSSVKDVVVTGWGDTENETTAVELRMAELKTITNEQCMAHILSTRNETNMNYQITENMLCAGNLEKQADACKGDSGGPLVSKGSNGRWHLEGIISWAIDKKCGHNYGIYTRVGRFVQWIRDVTAKMDSPD